MKDSTEVIEGEIVTERAIAPYTPKLLVTVEEAKRRHDENLDYMSHVLKEGVHYGVIPGTGSGKDARKSLLKPGAQALCRDMGLHPDPVTTEHILDVDGRDHNGEPFILYGIKVDIYAGDKKGWIGAGVGSCNSWEERYRWRTQVRTCPTCKAAAIIKGSEQYGGGWVCWKKKDGCGAKFANDDKRITDQPLGKVPNDRIMDLDNTIFKQAAKRALVEAVLNVTGASEIYTQDIDKGDEGDAEEVARMEATREQGAPAAATSTANRKPSGQAGLDTARAQQAEAARVPWTDEQKDKLRARVKVLQAEKHPVLYRGWKDFMVSLGQESWKILYSDQATLPKAYEILGIEVTNVEPVKQPEFDPTGAPA